MENKKIELVGEEIEIVKQAMSLLAHELIEDPLIRFMYAMMYGKAFESLTRKFHPEAFTQDDGGFSVADLKRMMGDSNGGSK